MTTNIAVLINAKFAEAVETAQYTSLNCKTMIDKLTATNRSAAYATITVHIVPAAGGAAESNAVSKSIAPGGTHTFPELVGHNMETGDILSTLASTVGAIWIRASGRKVS